MKLHAPATERNRDPIAAVLREILPQNGLVLEIASGSGEHAAYFARLFPSLEWQPSDPDPAALASITEWRAEEGGASLRAPILLDAASDDWPIGKADAILCINMVHISPWAATEGLMRGAGEILGTGAPLFLYGPYRQRDVPTAPSNEAFDRSLKARNAEWGLRNVEHVVALAERNGFVLDRVVPMPANNLSIVFRRA